MGLFSGLTNLFSGRTSPKPFPRPEEIFSGTPSMIPALPGIRVPNFTIGTDRPLFDSAGNERQSVKPALAHVETFASLWNTATKTYSWRWDEAYRRSRTDAVAMRRDCFLQSLLFERKYPTAQMSWHLEPDNKKDPVQAATCDYLKTCIDTLPNVAEMLMMLLDALWYGRAGIQIVWAWREINGPDGQKKRSIVPQDVIPVNGDKIQFEWDGTPQVRLYGGAKDDAPSEDFAWTDLGKMLRLWRPYWRDRFVIHQADIIDADWYEADMAGGVHGVGIRHWIYWYDFVRKEVATYILEFLERCGTGFTVYYYDPGNPQDAARAQQIAKQQGRNTWIIWPRQPGDKGAQSGVERIEPNTSGATVLKEMLSYYDQYIERFVVGQSMSSGADNESGLGGSGRAQFAKATKAYIITHDCLKLAGTLSRDLVLPLQRYNCPEAQFGIRWKFDIEKEDPEAKLTAGKTLVELGVPVIQDELRQAGGYAKPGADDETVGGQQQQSEQQQAQVKTQAVQQQAAQKLDTAKQMAAHKLEVSKQAADLKQEQQQQQHKHKLTATEESAAQKRQMQQEAHRLKLEQTRAAQQAGAFQGQQDSGSGGLFEGMPATAKEAEHHRPVRYAWEQRAVAAGLDPAKLHRLAEAIQEEGNRCYTR